MARTAVLHGFINRAQFIASFNFHDFPRFKNFDQLILRQENSIRTKVVADSAYFLSRERFQFRMSDAT